MGDQNDFDKKTQMEPFGRALESLMGTLDIDGAHVECQGMIAKSFRKIAGETVSSHTKNILYSDGRVTVVVDSGTWAQELTFLAEEYRTRLNMELGGEVVTAVTFCTRPMR